MRWRVALGLAIGASWLLYASLPVRPELLRFAAAGLCFSLASRAAAVVINSALSAHAHRTYRLRRDASEAASVAAERVREEVRVGLQGAEAARRERNEQQQG